jgi:hypothetical protein
MVTTDFYSLAIGFALAFLTVVGCLAMLLGWFFLLEGKLRRSQAADERHAQGRRAWPDACGEPDLAPPSTSAAARVEVDRLEELWRLPARRRPTPR